MGYRSYHDPQSRPHSHLRQLFNDTNCTGSPAALKNVRCSTCVELGNTTIFVNCSELQASSNGTNGTTGASALVRLSLHLGSVCSV